MTATPLIPPGASVTPFRRKLAELPPRSPSNDWYTRAATTLRGGDGGEHGLLLYKLILRAAESGHPVIALDIGTARGFSALTMARAMLDADIAGHVYSADIIAHHQPRHWHSEKQAPNEPLAGIQIPRSEIWSRWFPPVIPG